MLEEYKKRISRFLELYFVMEPYEILEDAEIMSCISTLLLEEIFPSTRAIQSAALQYADILIPMNMIEDSINNY